MEKTRQTLISALKATFPCETTGYLRLFYSNNKPHRLREHEKKKWKIISSPTRMEYFSSLIIRDKTYLDISLLVQRRLFQVELFMSSKTESFWLRMANARGMLPQSFAVDVTLTSRIFLLMTNCVSWSSGPGPTMAWKWTWSKWATGQTLNNIWRVLSLSWSLQKPREMW